MLKRLLPLLLLLLCILLDTAVIPIFYAGQYLLSLSLILVMLYGIQLGRLSGTFYGLIGGLLLDISTGTVGMKLISYVAIGFLIGFLLDTQPELTRSMSAKDRSQFLAVRAIWIFVLLMLNEIAMGLMQYIYTAVFSWAYVLHALLRTLMMTALSMLLYPLLHSMLFAGAQSRSKKRSFREVKRF